MTLIRPLELAFAPQIIAMMIYLPTIIKLGVQGDFLLILMAQLIVSGQISQIGANAPNPVKEAFKQEKKIFCFYHEMAAELVVEILEKKENAMIINVHL